MTRLRSIISRYGSPTREHVRPPTRSGALPERCRAQPDGRIECGRNGLNAAGQGGANGFRGDRCPLQFGTCGSVKVGAVDPPGDAIPAGEANDHRGFLALLELQPERLRLPRRWRDSTRFATDSSNPRPTSCPCTAGAQGTDRRRPYGLQGGAQQLHQDLAAVAPRPAIQPAAVRLEAVEDTKRRSTPASVTPRVHDA